MFGFWPVPPVPAKPAPPLVYLMRRLPNGYVWHVGVPTRGPHGVTLPVLSAVCGTEVPMPRDVIAGTGHPEAVKLREAPHAGETWVCPYCCDDGPDTERRVP